MILLGQRAITYRQGPEFRPIIAQSGDSPLCVRVEVIWPFTLGEFERK